MKFCILIVGVLALFAIAQAQVDEGAIVEPNPNIEPASPSDSPRHPRHPGPPGKHFEHQQHHESEQSGDENSGSDSRDQVKWGINIGFNKD